MRGRGGQPGFTVLELLVVLGIIGMLTAGLVIGGRRIRKSDLRSAAGRVAATLRFAFDRAAATGAHHRVVIDLDAGQLHVERCEGKLRLRRSIDEASAQDQDEIAQQVAALKAEAQKTAEQAAQAGAQPLGVGALAAPPPPPDAAGTVGAASCAPVKGRIGAPTRMRKGKILVQKVYVAHLEEPAGEGKVTVNFFPMGWAERAVIVVGDDEGNRYSLLLHPVTGRVDIESGEWRKPEKFVTEDAEGNEVTP